MKENRLFIVCVIFFLLSSCSLVEKKENIIHVLMDGNRELCVSMNPKENPLLCFDFIKEDNGILLYIYSLSAVEIKRITPYKEKNKVEYLQMNEKKSYPVYNAILERLDSCLELMNEKISLDSLTQINVRTWTLLDVGVAFSFNLEKNEKALKDRTMFDQYSIAINQTSLRKDINSILEKYSLRVDTITSGVEPKALGIPLQEFVKSRGIKKINQKMPKIITDAPITIFIGRIKR